MDALPENLHIDKRDLETISKMKSDDMGTVFKGVWKRTDGNQNVAIKTIRTRGKDAIADIFHELQIMAGLNHSNICHVYGACLVSEKEVWLVLELADGNLHDFLSTTTLTYHQQLSFAIQIAQALNYIHSLPTPIIHRDITTTSILVQKKGKTLLSGFGLAQTFSLVTSQTETFGSPRWAAPEVLDTDKTWSEKSDIYSLGMVLYEIVSGKLPFDEEDWNMEKIMKKIKGGKRPKIPKQCPKEFAKIIKLCWHASSKVRPSAKEVVVLLQECQVKSLSSLRTHVMGSQEEKKATWLCVQ